MLQLEHSHDQRLLLYHGISVYDVPSRVTADTKVPRTTKHAMYDMHGTINTAFRYVGRI